MNDTNTTGDMTPEPSVQAPQSERVRIHPVLGVVLYMVGYVVALVALSMFGAVLFGLLTAFAIVPELTLDPTLASMDVEAVLAALGPWFFPLIIGVGLFTIFYTWIFVRFIEGRRFGALGMSFHPGWGKSFAKGAAIAALLLAVMFAISVASGEIVVKGFARPAPEGQSVGLYFALSLIGFIVVGIYEELMFRGYVLQRLNERTGRVAAIVISSFLFAVLHFANPGAGMLSLVNTWVIGALLCALYYRSRSLWVPIGFHFAWNFLLGMFFSMPVSGLPIYGILEVAEVTEETAVSGAMYGPEGGLATTVALGLLAIWLLWKNTKPRTE
ncbi:CPBP family intramembrane metalloprotease [bacterium]|nr:CPBP family intramembrane metalloprotease [bacterium]